MVACHLCSSSTLRPKRQSSITRFLCEQLGWFYTQLSAAERCNADDRHHHLKFAELRSMSRRAAAADCRSSAKIAEILDTLDTTIRQTEAIIEKLKQVKQGLLHDLLTRGIDANGELRPPQSQAPHLYKDSPLGWIPREWEHAQPGRDLVG